MNANGTPTLARRAPLLAVTLILAGVVATPAAANIRQDVSSAMTSSGNITVTIENGVATLTGYGDSASKRAVERAVLENAEVDRVINLVLTNG